jgi:hypothetical protein
MSGTVDITGLQPGVSYQLADVFETLPGRQFLTGSYEAIFTGCTGGSIVGGAETITPGFQRAVPGPEGASSLLAAAKDPGSDALHCDYSVRYTGAGVPKGAISATRNDVWVLRQGVPVAELVSPEIQAAGEVPPPIIPEAPLAILLPMTGIVTALLWLRFRQRHAGGTIVR